MTAQIRPASSSDLEQIKAIMDLGFAADPTVRWVLPAAESFLTAHRKYVAISAAPALVHRSAYLTTDLTGAAIWYPPGVSMDYATLDEVARAEIPAKLWQDFSDLIDACGQYRPKEPHWSLELLAVDPIARGRGIGAQLLSQGIAACGTPSLPIYLESSNPRNLTTYQREGFELLAKVQLPGTPPRFPMLRKAQYEPG